jgi:hypothetical protein
VPRGDVREDVGALHRQLDPHRQPGGRPVHPPGRQVRGEQLDEVVAAAGQGGPVRPEPVGADRGEQLGGDHLVQGGRGQAGGGLLGGDRSPDRLVGADPADPQAAPEQLRRGADRDDPGAQRGQWRRRGLAVQHEVGQAEVLDDRGAAGVRDRRDGLAADGGEHRAGRVVACGHQVDEAARGASGSLDPARVGAARVGGHGDDAAPGAGECAGQPGVGGAGGDQGAVVRPECPPEQPERLLPARRDHQLVGFGGQSLVLGEVAGDLGAQQGQPGRVEPVAVQRRPRPLRVDRR